MLVDPTSEIMAVTWNMYSPGSRPNAGTVIDEWFVATAIGRLQYQSNLNKLEKFTPELANYTLHDK